MHSPKYPAKSNSFPSLQQSQRCRRWPAALKCSKSSASSQTNSGVSLEYIQKHWKLEIITSRHRHVDESFKTYWRLKRRKPCTTVFHDRTESVTFISPDGILGTRTFGLCVNTILLHASFLYREQNLPGISFKFMEFLVLANLCVTDSLFISQTI